MMSTYEKLLFALVLEVLKWSRYLLGQIFVVKTNQQSFKYLIDQNMGIHMR